MAQALIIRGRVLTSLNRDEEALENLITAEKHHPDCETVASDMEKLK